LDEDFFERHPQIGWLTPEYEERDADGNGVGDDVHGWATDGVRHKRWHNGPAEAAWPRSWQGGDVIGLAIDIEDGQMYFSLNGEWVPGAQMTFKAEENSSFFPALSMTGRFVMHIPRGSWKFAPPDEDYQAWAESGSFARPLPPAAPVEVPGGLQRQVSQVEGPGVLAGEALSVDNLQAFAEAVLQKALTGNLQPQLDAVVSEFRRVVPPKIQRSLSWQQVQDRISGQRLDPEAFIEEWRGKTTYQGCGEEDENVKLWWDYVSEHTPAELQRLFSWCTGYAAIPTTAWKFQIKAVDDTARCPTINTCMTDDPSAANRGVKMPTLYLPGYDSKATLAQKMEWAIAGASTMNLH